MVIMARNNRESLQPVLEWMDANIAHRQRSRARRRSLRRRSATATRESTALKLADQGGFWVGVQRKKMPYGDIAHGADVCAVHDSGREEAPVIRS